MQPAIHEHMFSPWLCAQCCACSILCASTSTKLQAADVGSFYKLQANLLREALRTEGAAVEAGSLRRSCPGLEVRSNYAYDSMSSAT